MSRTKNSILEEESFSYDADELLKAGQGEDDTVMFEDDEPDPEENEDLAEDTQAIPEVLPREPKELKEARDAKEPKPKKSLGQTVVEDEVYDPENWEGSHPAEIAARLQKQMRSDRVIGNSDEAILRELRTSVFSVPLMPQHEVSRLFNLVDSEMKPLVHDLMERCGGVFEEVFQVVIKVAAGNTYGKNIYEKSDNPEPEAEYKSTFKKHELEFLANAAGVFEVFAHPGRQAKDIGEAMDRCLFIRGVYEEALDSFLGKTSSYLEMHWDAFELRLAASHEPLGLVLDKISEVDKLLGVNGPIFGQVLRARSVKRRFSETRSKIIAPYLRSVYSQAKKTAKNAQQMLENFQNGSIGLIRAISCYSTRRSASFASVAKWWIKQMMLLSIKEDANFVKLPVSTWQAYTQLEKARAKLSCTEEDIDLIASEAKMPTKKAKSVYETVKIAQVYSLNRTYDADEKLTLEDIVTNESKLGYRESEFEDTVRFYCDRANLPVLDTKILAFRHGMFDILTNYAPLPTDPAVTNECVVQHMASLGYRFRPRPKNALC